MSSDFFVGVGVGIFIVWLLLIANWVISSRRWRR